MANWEVDLRVYEQLIFCFLAVSFEVVHGMANWGFVNSLYSVSLPSILK